MLNKSNLRYLTKYEEAVLRADLAHGYFIYGKDQKAIPSTSAIVLQAQKSRKPIGQLASPLGVRGISHLRSAISMYWLNVMMRLLH